MDTLAQGLGLILFVGMVAQWAAWRFNLPAILLLLVTGLMVGPLSSLVLGHRLLDPDLLFGEGLFPIVSIAVGIILFEGGLTLNFRELKQSSRYVRNLIFLGALITWTLAALGAYFILGFSLQLALLLGAVLVVTGPTVIIPLLRQVRLKGDAGKILRWEGVLNDPIGAILAVLVFEAIRFSEADAAFGHVFTGLLTVIFVSVGASVIFSGVIILACRWHLIPDYLQSPVILGFVVAAFVVSEQFQHEAGLLTTTLMGLIMANQRDLALKHVQEFKENLRVLIISALFIVLAARVTIEDLSGIGWSSVLFVVFLILIVRPATAFLCGIRTRRTWQELAMVGWMAPRGIVAVAIVSIFTLELSRQGVPDAERLLTEMLVVILGTVTVYGLTARPMAKWLKLTNVNPRGLLFVGAHRWARALARAVQEAGGKVFLTDTNYHNIEIARDEGLQAFQGNIATEDFFERLDLTEIGRVLALTPNDEVNSLACVNFTDYLDRSRIFQLVPFALQEKNDAAANRSRGGRFLFDRRATFDFLNAAFRMEEPLRTFELTEDFDFDAYLAEHRERWLPLFEITQDDRTLVVTAENSQDPKPGSKLVCLRVAVAAPLSTRENQEPEVPKAAETAGEL